jgi:hypothetical protein
MGLAAGRCLSSSTRAIGGDRPPPAHGAALAGLAAARLAARSDLDRVE